MSVKCLIKSMQVKYTVQNDVSFLECLQGPVKEALESESTFKCVEAKRTPATYDKLPGVLVLGDAFNSRDHVVASGMTAAFKDVLFWQRAVMDIPELSKRILCTSRPNYAPFHRS